MGFFLQDQKEAAMPSAVCFEKLLEQMFPCVDPASLLLRNHLKNNHEITWGKHLHGIQQTTSSEAQESQERRRERAGAIQARLRLGQRQAPRCVA